ncbi:MAG: hypothetical protein GX896_02040, partial [Clostridiales bacterium]|nr:hypothetical protein [Clostridiales bacterium]
ATFTPSQVDLYNTVDLLLNVEVYKDIDTTKLEKMIDEALEIIDNLKETDIGNGNGQYPKTKVDYLKKEIENAKSVLENTASSQLEIDKVIENLSSAISLLKNSKTAIDFTSINKLIEYCEKLTVSDDYSNESWSNLQEVLNSAKSVILKENVTQSEVDAAEKELKSALNKLTTKNPQTGDNLKSWIPISLVVLMCLSLAMGTKAKKSRKRN